MKSFHTRNPLSPKACLLSLLVVGSLMALTQANVIGIDFGTSFFKITLVKPGQPFTIVENTSTQRKTHNQFTITEDSRIFGADSFLQSTRYPKNTFAHVTALLGSVYDEQVVEEIKKQNFVFNELAADDRGLVGWKFQKKPKDENDPTEEIFYTEELIAVLLKFGKHLSEKQAEGTIRDCVITIPSYFTASQRRMMLDAADLAGLSVLQLIHENTAAATMYGIDRLDSEKPHTVLFYNMGGKDTEVSIARYTVFNDTSANKLYEHIEILGEAWKQNLGGHHLDLVLVNMLADTFNGLKEREGKPDIRENPKAMRRLFKEVIKAKDILSANKHIQLKISELADYVSLSLDLERANFYEAAENFFAQIYDPVEEVLQKTGLTIQDIDAVELLGGGIRVPRIQEILQEKMQISDLGVHLNGDEAMCFGSAFIASNSSASFKVRKIYLTVHPSYQIAIQITPQDESKLSGAGESQQEEVQEEGQQEGNTEEGEAAPAEVKPVQYEKNYVLYKINDFLGQKKSLSFTYDTDMKIQVFKEDLNGERDPLATFLVNGIDKVAQNDVSQKEGSSKPKVTLSFELSRSGLLTLNKAEAKVEELVWVEEKPKKKKKEKAEEKEEEEEKQGEQKEEQEADKKDGEQEQKEEEEKPNKKLEKRPQSFPLSNITKEFFGQPTLNRSQISAAKERLRFYERRDEDKIKTDKAKNDFESVIYTLRDWISEDGNQPFLNDSELETSQKELMEQEDWLYEEGDQAMLTEYNKRYQSLNAHLNKFKTRKSEYLSRDKEVESSRLKLNQLEESLEKLEKKKDWIPEEKRKDVWDKLAETRTWIDEVVEKQKEVKLNEDPAFTVSELEAKIKKVDSLFNRVNNMQKPKSDKYPKNFKIDNVTIDGNSGDVNWEDLIKIVPPPGSDDDDDEDKKKSSSKIEDLAPEEEL